MNRLMVLIGMLVMALAGSATAQMDVFYHGPGSWSTAANWYDENGSPAGRVPNSADWGMINQGEVTVDSAAAAIGGMSVGDTWNGGAAQLTIVAGGDLHSCTRGNVYVGNGAPGTILTTGGALTIDKDLELRGGEPTFSLTAERSGATSMEAGTTSVASTMVRGLASALMAGLMRRQLPPRALSRQQVGTFGSAAWRRRRAGAKAMRGVSTGPSMTRVFTIGHQVLRRSKIS